MPLELIPINTGPDLTDPVQLAAACETAAGGLRQQAQGITNGNGLGSHPNPAFLFNNAAHVLDMAYRYIKAQAGTISSLPFQPGTVSTTEQPAPPKRGRPPKVAPLVTEPEAPVEIPAETPS